MGTFVPAQKKASVELGSVVELGICDLCPLAYLVFAPSSYLPDISAAVLLFILGAACSHQGC